MRRPRKGALVAATATPVLFAIFGTALVGGSGLGWFAGLIKPWFLVPLWVFFLVGSLYYVLAAVVLYRVLVHVDEPKGRAVCFAITGCDELGNLFEDGVYFLFFGISVNDEVQLVFPHDLPPFHGIACGRATSGKKRDQDLSALRPFYSARNYSTITFFWQTEQFARPGRANR